MNEFESLDSKTFHGRWPGGKRMYMNTNYFSIIASCLFSKFEKNHWGKKMRPCFQSYDTLQYSAFIYQDSSETQFKLSQKDYFVGL